MTLDIDVKNGDNLLCLATVSLSVSADTQPTLSFKYEGVESTLEHANRIEATGIFRTHHISELCAITADNTAFTVDLMWRNYSGTATITANARSLIVIRIRPTG
jgi:hypothetical protein